MLTSKITTGTANTINMPESRVSCQMSSDGLSAIRIYIKATDKITRTVKILSKSFHAPLPIHKSLLITHYSDDYCTLRSDTAPGLTVQKYRVLTP